MKMLYHREVYMPPNLKFSVNAMPLQYGRHARQAATEDRYGDLTALLPKMFTPKPEELVELELTDKVVTKAVFRLQVTADLDLCLVVIPQPGFWFVKTVWGNLRSDKHSTLDRSKYATR